MKRINTLQKRVKKYLENNIIILLIWFVVVFLSSVITITQGSSLLVNFYRNSLGKKVEQYNILSKLRPGVQIAYFNELLGSQTMIHSLPEVKVVLKEHIYVRDNYYVQAITDIDDNVQSFAVTSRKKDFQPTFLVPGYLPDDKTLYVTLNKTHFADISPRIKTSNVTIPQVSNTKPSCYFAIGAHDYYYFEGYYLANPGNYQSAYVGVNMIGYTKGDKLEQLIGSLPDMKDTDSNCLEVPEVTRNNVEINTFVLTDKFQFEPQVASTSARYIFGADFYDVRVLENE